MIKLEVYYLESRDELEIYKIDPDTGKDVKDKEYNRINTPGDVGRAVKDFMMEIENE